jgi:hypothetical protein
MSRTVHYTPAAPTPAWKKWVTEPSWNRNGVVIGPFTLPGLLISYCRRRKTRDGFSSSFPVLRHSVATGNRTFAFSCGAGERIFIKITFGASKQEPDWSGSIYQSVSPANDCPFILA